MSFYTVLFVLFHVKGSPTRDLTRIADEEKKRQTYQNYIFMFFSDHSAPKKECSTLSFTMQIV